MPQRSFRKRKESNEEDSESEDSHTDSEWRERLQLTKSLQKQRGKAQGINADSARPSAGNQATQMNAAEVMGGYIKEQVKDKAESDPEREKFIQEQLDKRLGRNNTLPETEGPTSRADDMYAIPAALRTQKANQEDVSAWMTGIVEVPLSVTQRLKNVEETEEAKRKLLAQSGDTLTGERSDREKEKQMSRLTLPLKFGQHSEKDALWQAAALSKQGQPREWKRKKRAPA